MRRARPRHSVTPKSKSIPAQIRQTPKARASRDSSIKSSRPEPIPGYATGSLGIGTPTFYHRAAIEIGGSTPDRLFSYYVGIAGSNQAFNYVNDNNGSEYDNWLGPPLGIVGGPLRRTRLLPAGRSIYGNTGEYVFSAGTGR